MRQFLEGRRVAWAQVVRVGAVASVLAALLAPAPASAAPGVLEASVVECGTFDGEPGAVVGVSITAASPNTEIWLRVTDQLIVAPPAKFSVGFTDAGGSLTHRFVKVARAFPLGVRAFTSGTEKEDPESEIGSGVGVPFVCPDLSPQAAVGAAVENGVLTEREATPLAVKLGAAAAQEEKGNTQAAINLLEASRQQVQAMIASGRLTAAEAQPLIDAINREIQRLGGNP
jgi:hypothetical protein